MVSEKQNYQLCSQGPVTVKLLQIIHESLECNVSLGKQISLEQTVICKTY